MATDLRKAKDERRRTRKGEPTWDVVRLFPQQGYWSEEEYLELDTNQLVEYSDGFVEFLPMPTIFHQLILQFLYRELDAFVRAGKLGTVVIAGYKARLRAGKYREPDVMFIKAEHASRIGKQFCEGADLAFEVVSEENREHDIVTKRAEYAKARIPEYWIIDPEQETITVLTLKPRAKSYVLHGIFGKGTRATSKLLPGFSVDVTTALEQKP
jgi:Uma2 family endonuclease